MGTMHKLLWLPLIAELNELQILCVISSKSDLKKKKKNTGIWISEFLSTWLKLEKTKSHLQKYLMFSFLIGLAQYKAVCFQQNYNVFCEMYSFWIT